MPWRKMEKKQPGDKWVILVVHLVTLALMGYAFYVLLMVG